MMNQARWGITSFNRESKGIHDEIALTLTYDVQKRLAAHNAGQSSHTSKYAPWELVAFFGFAERAKAAAFEEYLKSGSGRAFASRRLW
jgi:predicted GIY-YIG superfamily endonuclease